MTEYPPLDLDAKRVNKGLSHPHVFRLNGREWHVKARVKPEAFLAYVNLNTDTPDEKVGEILDDLICSLLVESDREDWRAARAADTDDQDISLGEMEDIITWATPLVTGRPLALPSDSSTGAPTPTTGQTSAAASSSPEETPPLSIAGTS
jgi:hypothetical protein